MDKRFEVKVTPFAEQSMREIAQYIAFDLLAPETAVNLLLKLKEEIAKLDFMPGRLHLTPEEPWHSMGVHRFKVKNFYVYFWIDEEKLKVQVTDVTYVRRDQHWVLENMPFDGE